MKNIRYFNSNGTLLALSNLTYRDTDSVVDITDAVEESRTGNELVQKINDLKLLRTFSFDKETATHVRLKSVDRLGNVHYLEAEKDAELLSFGMVPMNNKLTGMIKDTTDKEKIRLFFELGKYILENAEDSSDDKEMSRLLDDIASVVRDIRNMK